jgi:hypothetical protein
MRMIYDYFTVGSNKQVKIWIFKLLLEDESTSFLEFGHNFFGNWKAGRHLLNFVH